MTTTPVQLSIRGLRAEYRQRRGLIGRPHKVTILENFDLDVFDRETLGLVGESGSGKTTLIQTILGLLRPAAGTIRLGSDTLTGRRSRREVQVVFQNPFSSLDPHLSVLDIVTEPLVVHRVGTRPERRTIAVDLLENVGLGPRFLTAYPHELSGGQAQRVALARALALRPRLLLLDEPTSSLDVSVQAQVLNLLLDLQAKFGLTYLFVTHDLSVVQHISDRIAVMYLGQIVELGPTEEIFASPGHPYTQALLAASGQGNKTAAVRGTSTPTFADPPRGCRFHPRCPHVMDVCRRKVPPSASVGPGWVAKCYLVDMSKDHGATSDAKSESTREAVNG
jgi:oligopeptide/dipeptide ABC transporter ATP-binding protein